MNRAFKKLAVKFPTRGEGDDDGGGDNGSGDDTTFNQSQVDALVAAAKGEADSGLKTKNAELLASVNKMKKDGKKFEGVDLDGLLALKETVANDEILTLLADGKHSEALDKQTERLTVAHTAAVEGLNTQIAELTESGVKNVALLDKLLIDGGSQKAFLEANGLKTAVEDIALRARQVWKVEDGLIVARDAEGKMIQGKDGALTMSEWSESLKETAAHLFPASEGGSGNGGDGSGAGDSGSLEAQMIAASSSGNQAKLRELSKKLRDSKKGR